MTIFSFGAVGPTYHAKIAMDIIFTLFQPYNSLVKIDYVDE